MIYEYGTRNKIFDFIIYVIQSEIPPPYQIQIAQSKIHSSFHIKPMGVPSPNIRAQKGTPRTRQQIPRCIFRPKSDFRRGRARRAVGGCIMRKPGNFASLDLRKGWKSHCSDFQPRTIFEKSSKIPCSFPEKPFDFQSFL